MHDGRDANGHGLRRREHFGKGKLGVCKRRVTPHMQCLCTFWGPDWHSGVAASSAGSLPVFGHVSIQKSIDKSVAKSAVKSVTRSVV